MATIYLVVFSASGSSRLGAITIKSASGMAADIDFLMLTFYFAYVSVCPSVHKGGGLERYFLPDERSG